MITPAPQQFLNDCVAAAKQAKHVFPEMAACEAALESAWGSSKLAIDALNLFGKKMPANYQGQTISIPTREYLNGAWVTVPAEWVKYAALGDCFTDRMATLVRLSSSYPHYANAISATTPEEYIAEVSQTWSTDPQRAAKVKQIYDAHIVGATAQGQTVGNS
jgi:flagellum-specific peptidoglycan hydrolase FlgJ